jgi:hypothetical protein
LLGFLVEISDEQRFLSLWFFLLMLHIIVLCHLSLEITKICEFWSLWWICVTATGYELRS